MTASTALVFPGQGSQSVGMLADLADAHPVIAETFAEASSALGEDLWALAAEGPAEVLDATENTQPVLLAASVAVQRAWAAAGGASPSVVAGHSLGEYSALVVAGALELADAVRVVRARGLAMQRAVPAGSGAMAAILGLDDETVEGCCEASADGAVVSAANYNAPGQVVIAGDRDAVDRAIEACKAVGAKRAMALAVSVPSHCALMAPARAPLAEALDGVELRAPSVPVIQNVDATASTDPAAIREKLLEQLQRPVRWTSCFQALAASGASRALECGPGKVLSGLGKRIDRAVEMAALGSADGLAAALADQG